MHVPHEPIVCNDGFTMSVQASSYHYCTPRRDGERSTLHTKLGFPTRATLFLCRTLRNHGARTTASRSIRATACILACQLKPSPQSSRSTADLFANTARQQNQSGARTFSNAGGPS